jgi:hypothetical protein
MTNPSAIIIPFLPRIIPEPVFRCRKQRRQQPTIAFGPALNEVIYEEIFETKNKIKKLKTPTENGL